MRKVILIMLLVPLLSFAQVAVKGTAKITGTAKLKTAVAACSPSDNFTGSAGQNLTVYSANWTVTQGAFALDGIGDLYANQGFGLSMAYWNACTPAANQFAQATIQAVGSGAVGIAVRVGAGANVGYVFQWGSTNSYKLLLENGASETTLFTDTNTCSAGQVARLEVTGTSIIVKCNGVQVISVTDATLASGSVGVAGFHNDTGTLLKTWSGGAI